MPNFVGFVPLWFLFCGFSCHRTTVPSWKSKIFPQGHFVGAKFVLVGISWIQNFFFFGISWGPKFFLVSISWVQNIFPWLFFGSEIVSHVYFAGPTFFMVSISWVRNFCVRAFCGFKIFSSGHLWGP